MTSFRHKMPAGKGLNYFAHCTRSGHILSFLLPLFQEGQLSVTGESMRGLSLPRKSVVRLTDRPDMTLDVYRGRKTTIQQYFAHWEVTVSLALFVNYFFLSLNHYRPRPSCSKHR